MSALPPIVVRQPAANDLVDDPMDVCGIASAFEGQFAARVVAANGATIAHTTISTGFGTGWANFHVTIGLGGALPTTSGRLEVFEHSPADGSEINTVVVPVVFGRSLIQPYHGFGQHTVVAGDTLSGIAQRFYGDAAGWNRIFEANRNVLGDPNLIRPGQVLRIPM